MSRIRYLTDREVGELLTMERAVELMREAFVALSGHRAQVPVRTNLDLGGGASALIMPVHVAGEAGGGGRLGLKQVTVCPANPARGLPTIQGLMLVSDAETGRPLALMDAERLTAIRTGAASGLATELLARPEASTAAIFGAGGQARTQLEGVCAVRPIRRAWVFAPTDGQAELYAREMATLLGIEVRVADAAERLAEADVVCTATTSAEPVFDPAHIAPGTHINGVGSYRPDTAEIPPEIVAAATVVVDHRPSCLAEAGDLHRVLATGVAPEDLIHAELGEIAAGTRPARRSEKEITLFKSVGNAVQDLTTAAWLAAQ